MTQPTQELPPFLSASSFTFTSQGIIFSGVSTVEVPITYFGPSIPLGTDGVWTFGGSTSPPPSSATSAIPTSTSAPVTSSPTLSSSPTSSPSSSSSSTLTSSPSSSGSSTTPPPSSSTSESRSSSSSTSRTSSSLPAPTLEAAGRSSIRRDLPAIIIAPIGVTLLLTALLLWCMRRRRQRRKPFDLTNQSEFLVVDPEGQPRLAGEGVARQTGEEEDPFLGMGTGVPGEQMAERNNAGITLKTIPPTPSEPSSQTPRPSFADQSGSLRGAPKIPTALGHKPFFGSVSSLFFNPARGPDPVPSGEPGQRDSLSPRPSMAVDPPRGPIMNPRELLQLDDEWQREAAASVQEGDSPELRPQSSNSPLRPPPPLNPDAVYSTRRNSGQTQVTQLSAPYSESPNTSEVEPDESATFLTAQHVTASEAAPRTMVVEPQSRRTSIGFTRLPRLSWFRRVEASPTRSGTSTQVRPRARMLTDRELRAGRTVLGAVSSSSLAPGERPLSHVSTGSALSSTGQSVFHDAVSTYSRQSRPTTPFRGGPPQPPPDHAIPPVPAYPAAIASSSTPPPRASAQALQQTDILDVPAPTATRQLSTASSTVEGPALPPGLEHLTSPTVWRESAVDIPVPASILGSDYLGRSADVVIAVGGRDVLEEEPPRAGEGWASLRAMTGDPESERRTTLGQPLDRDEIFYERGSLNNIPSGLSNLNPAASGSHSRPPSRARQSPYPASNSSSGSSLGHANSISSDGRRRNRREPGEPPAPPPTAFPGRASLSALGNRSPFNSQPNSPAAMQGTFNSGFSGGSTSVSEYGTVLSTSNGSHGTVGEPSTADRPHFPTVPWRGM